VVMQRGRDMIVGRWEPPYLIDEQVMHGENPSWGGIRGPIEITHDMRLVAVVSGLARRTRTCPGS
jgi:hypothetical protein